MSTNELLSMFLQLLAPAVLDMLGLAALGMAVAAFFCQLAGKVRSMVFFDKYAQQSATLGLWLLAIALISGAAFIWILLGRFPALADGLAANTGLVQVDIVSAALYVVAFLAYALLWKKLRKSRGIHMFLGAVAAMNAMTVMAATGALFLILPGGTENPLALDASSLLWPTSACILFLGIVHATGLSGPYLALRRNRDDFGRDYYAFAMRTAATRALSAMVLLLAASAWLWFVLPAPVHELMAGTSLWMAWAGIGLCGLLCIGLWAAIAANQQPMRLKGLSFAAVVLLWLLHTLTAVVWINLFLMLSAK